MVISGSHSRRKRLEWDSETCVEKNPSHMENHTKYMYSLNCSQIGTISGACDNKYSNVVEIKCCINYLNTTDLSNI